MIKYYDNEINDGSEVRNKNELASKIVNFKTYLR